MVTITLKPATIRASADEVQSPMTILDACVKVLDATGRPMKAEEIFDEVRRQKLYDFGAKDPLSILRGTLRKHVRSTGRHRIREAERGVYQLA